MGSNPTPSVEKVLSRLTAAAPFVAGVAAQVLQANPSYGSGQVESTIKALATFGVVSGTMSGDPNLFVFRY